MSEYLIKKAVLEFIKSRKAKFAGSYKDIEYGAYLELETIETHIESGAFDADATYDEWRQLAADSIAEIQRLRAELNQALEALEWIVECSTDYQSISKARNALHFIKGGAKRCLTHQNVFSANSVR